MIPFELKNAKATYQRLVKQMFTPLIEKTMEVYIDDILTKSLKARNHVADLKKTFDIHRKYKIKLNLAKCTFEVNSRKFLGSMVDHQGIEANPAMIKALIEMKSPGKIKKIQRLTGMIVALTRFVSRSIDKCRPLFQALKKGREMKWIEECEEAFQNIKQYLGNPPMLSKPKEGENHYVYLTVSEYVVNSVLIRE